MPRDKGDEPAFPVTVEMMSSTGGFGGQGMTLRDYFAAKAMQGLVSSEKNSHFSDKVEVTAEEAYEIADAMLKARKVSDA